jgi:hypothetical protein
MKKALTIRILRLFAFVLVAVTLAACSVATVAYNNASTLMTYAVKDYFDLSPSQEEWVRGRAGQFIAWHRANELPQYRRMLGEAKKRAESGMSAAEVEAAYLDGRGAFLRVADRMVPDVVELVQQLDAQQIQFFEDKLTRDNEKLARESRGQAQKQLQKRIERFEERFSDWMGDLTPAQRAEIRAAASAMKPLDDLRLADRRKRQAEFLAIMKSRADAATMTQQLRQMIAQPDRLRDPAYRDELDKQQRVFVQLIARMSTDATPEQRARVQKRLTGYSADISNLLARS